MLPSLMLALALALPGATPAPTQSTECPATAHDTALFAAMPSFTVNAPRGTLALSVALNTESRERGLMCVTALPPGRGMIFVFPGGNDMQSFWMKNTLVQLDMLFVDADGTVTSVAAHVPATPLGTSDAHVARRQGTGKFVIELGGGDAARHHIVKGTKLALPPLRAEDE